MDRPAGYREEQSGEAMNHLEKARIHYFTICLPSRCEHCDTTSHKNYCLKELELGGVPSEETMLNCALRYYWDRADELERLRAMRRRESRVCTCDKCIKAKMEREKCD